MPADAKAPRTNDGATLNAKQAQFVREYLIDLNATQAAIRCGYSAKTAHVQGCRLLSDAKIAAAVEAAMAKRAERTEITADRVLQELAKVGFANLSDVTDWGVREVAFGFTQDGNRLPPEEIGDAAVVRYADAPFVRPIDREELPDQIKAAVSEVALTKDGFRIKMHDKVGALTQIGRHLGMFSDKIDHVNSDGSLKPPPPTVIQILGVAAEHDDGAAQATG